MTAYLLWLGLEEAELSLWRGAGALAGIGATFAYPRLHAVAGALTSWRCSPHLSRFHLSQPTHARRGRRACLPCTALRVLKRVSGMPALCHCQQHAMRLSANQGWKKTSEDVA